MLVEKGWDLGKARQLRKALLCSSESGDGYVIRSTEAPGDLIDRIGVEISRYC